MKVFLVTLLLIAPCITSAQFQAERIDRLMNREQVDTFMIGFTSCAYVAYEDSCSEPPPSIVIWKKNGMYFSKRFETCYDFPTQLVEGDSPLFYYLEHATDIDSITQHPAFELVIRGEGDRPITTRVVEFPPEDGCFECFETHVNAKVIHKKNNMQLGYNDDSNFKRFDPVLLDKEKFLRSLFILSKAYLNSTKDQPRLEVER